MLDSGLRTVKGLHLFEPVFHTGHIRLWWTAWLGCLNVGANLASVHTICTEVIWHLRTITLNLPTTTCITGTLYFSLLRECIGGGGWLIGHVRGRTRGGLECVGIRKIDGIGRMMKRMELVHWRIHGRGRGPDGALGQGSGGEMLAGGRLTRGWSSKGTSTANNPTAAWLIECRMRCNGQIAVRGLQKHITTFTYSITYAPKRAD